MEDATAAQLAPFLARYGLVVQLSNSKGRCLIASRAFKQGEYVAECSLLQVSPAPRTAPAFFSTLLSDQDCGAWSWGEWGRHGLFCFLAQERRCLRRSLTLQSWMATRSTSDAIGVFHCQAIWRDAQHARVFSTVAFYARYCQQSHSWLKKLHCKLLNDKIHSPRLLSASSSSSSCFVNNLKMMIYHLSSNPKCNLFLKKSHNASDAKLWAAKLSSTCFWESSSQQASHQSITFWIREMGRFQILCALETCSNSMS